MPPPPVVPAGEAEAGALDGSGGSLRLFVLVLLIVLFGFVTFLMKKMKEIERSKGLSRVSRVSPIVLLMHELDLEREPIEISA